MKKKWWIAGFIVSLVVGGYLIYTRWIEPPATRAQGEEQITELRVVERGTLQEAIEATGNLTPVRERSLSFETGGRVAEVYVTEGESVREGQPLVQLERTSLELALASAGASLQQAEVRLAQVLEGASEAQIAAEEAMVSSAQASYALVKEGASEEQLAQLQAEMERAAKEVRRAQGNYERAGQNVHAGLELQDATLAYEQARLAYEIALDVDNHDLASAWSKVEGAQADLEALLAEPTEEEVEAAELSVQRAQLALERAQRQYDDATLSAPFDGTVTALTAVVGERVSGAVVVIVADLDALEVEITLDEGDVARVSEGQEALLTVEALEDVSISGEVVEIAPQGETKSGVVLYPVTVKLTERPERVRAGMTTDVEIVTERWENVLHLPQRAVQLEGDRAYLLVQGASGEFERVPVVLGRRVGGHVEILEGVNEGAVVGVLTAIEVEEGDDGTQMPGMNMLRRRF